MHTRSAVAPGGHQQLGLSNAALMALLETTRASLRIIQEVALRYDIPTQSVEALPVGQRPGARSPEAVLALVHAEMSPLAQEQVRILIVDNQRNVMAQRVIYQGTAVQCPMRLAEVFRPVIELGGVGMIVAHNHPSGSVTPSREDVAMTRDLVAAGKLLDIEVLDHIIIAGDCTISLRRTGVGFESATGDESRV